MLVPNLGDLGRRPGPGPRPRPRPGRRGGYYPYLYPPAYYYQQVEEPKPKYAIINPAGNVVAIVTGMPTGLPAGYTARPATVAEVVKASGGAISGLGEGEESLF